MTKNPNHFNFIASEENIEYLCDLAQKWFNSPLEKNRSELFRRLIEEHQMGKVLTNTAFITLRRLANYYDVSPEEFLEKLLLFINKKKPDISILGF